MSQNIDNLIINYANIIDFNTEITNNSLVKEIYTYFNNEIQNPNINNLLSRNLCIRKYNNERGFYVYYKPINNTYIPTYIGKTDRPLKERDREHSKENIPNFQNYKILFFPTTYANLIEASILEFDSLKYHTLGSDEAQNKSPTALKTEIKKLYLQKQNHNGTILMGFNVATSVAKYCFTNYPLLTCVGLSLIGLMYSK